MEFVLFDGDWSFASSVYEASAGVIEAGREYQMTHKWQSTTLSLLRPRLSVTLPR